MCIVQYDLSTGVYISPLFLNGFYMNLFLERVRKFADTLMLLFVEVYLIGQLPISEMNLTRARRMVSSS